VNIRPLSVIVQPCDSGLLRSFLRAAFAIFVRVGLPFTLHMDWGSVDPVTDVACYGPPQAEGRRAYKGIAMLPRAACPLEQCKPFRGDDGVPLWGTMAQDGIDLISGAAALLSFVHEAAVSADHRDWLGRIPAARHPLSQLQLLDQPLLEHATLQIRRWCAQKGISVENARSPWPGKVPVVLTHDVDGPFLHSWFALARSAFYALCQGSRKERDALEFGLISLLRNAQDPYFGFFDGRGSNVCLVRPRCFLFILGGRQKSRPPQETHTTGWATANSARN